MQRFAFLPTGERIDAIDATHRVDYYCPECRGVVRVRRGEERVAHFFHKNEGTSCHLRLKDGIHEAVQSWLVSALGPSACTLECHFPSISRVADVAFHPQKIVFEVQVSPIKPEEAIQRTLDYWSLGWHVIWLLHAATFGRSKASPFEKILLPIPHYFTDIGYRTGKLWDELSAVRGERRFWYVFPPQRHTIDDLAVEILRPPQNSLEATGFPQTAHQCAEMRRLVWSCRFCNDLLACEIPRVCDRKKLWDWEALWKRAKVKCHLFWLHCIR